MTAETTPPETDPIAAAHVADAALDGGPHGLPVLGVGQGWRREAGGLLAVGLASQAGLEAAETRLSSVESRRLDQVPAPTAPVSLNGQKVTALAASTAAGEAVRHEDARLSDARAPTAHPHPQSDVTGLAGTLATKADLVGGVVPTAQVPAIATGQTVTVASQAAMLALTAAQVQPGDVAIRSDQSGRRWVLAAADPAVLANWIALEVPDAVSSVNGQSGAVVLAKSDVGLSNTDNTADSAKPVSPSQRDALPWTIHISVIPMASRESGAWVLDYGGTYRFNSGQSNGNYIEWDLGLAAGTWDIDFFHYVGPADGIVTLSLAGNDVASVDCYAAANAPNVRHTISGIVVAASGKISLRMRLNGKNASSTGYRTLIQGAIGLRRTA